MAPEATHVPLMDSMDYPDNKNSKQPASESSSGTSMVHLLGVICGSNWDGHDLSVNLSNICIFCLETGIWFVQDAVEILVLDKSSQEPSRQVLKMHRQQNPKQNNKINLDPNGSMDYKIKNSESNYER